MEVIKKRKNKYRYYRVLQGKYDGIWSDLVSYNMADKDYFKELRSDLHSYMQEDPRQYRVIDRRVLNQ